MTERTPLSGTKRLVMRVVGFVIVGAALALLIRGVIARIDSGAGLSRVHSTERCRAAPGCEASFTRVLAPGLVLMVIAAFVQTRIEGRSLFSRRRAPSGTVKLTRRTSTTMVTRYRSTWDGPVAEVQTTTRHESGDPLSAAEADHLIQMFEDPHSEVVVEGGDSEEARQQIAAMLGMHASRANTRELSRAASIGLAAAGATVALVYAQLVL